MIHSKLRSEYISELGNLLVGPHHDLEPQNLKTTHPKLSRDAYRLAIELSKTAHPDRFEWADLYTLIRKKESFQSPIQAEAQLKKVLGYSPNGLDPQVSVRLEVLPFQHGNKKGQISLTYLSPNPEIAQDRPPLIFVPGLNHPAPAYEKILTKIAKQQGREVIVMDLFGNGGSVLIDQKGITAEDLYQELQHTIRHSIPKDGEFELVSFSLGTLIGRRLNHDYHYERKRWKLDLGNRKLTSSLWIAPVPSQAEILAGIKPNRAFFYLLTEGIVLKQAMIYDYEVKRHRRRDLFTGQHSKSDRQLLWPLISRNQLPTTIRSIAGIQQSINGYPMMEEVQKGHVRVIFHETDELFTLKNPEAWSNRQGIYLLPGDHSACAGLEVPEKYIHHFMEALEAKPSSISKPINFAQPYRRFRFDISTNLSIGSQQIGLEIIQLSGHYGTLDLGRFGLSLSLGTETNAEWGYQNIFNFFPLNPFLGISFEGKGHPIELTARSQWRTSVNFPIQSREKSGYWEAKYSLQLETNYYLLEIFSFGLQIYANSPSIIKSEKTSFWEGGFKIFTGLRF